eukprot:691464_1
MSHSPAHSTHSNDPPIDTPSAHNKELPPHTIIHHDSIMHHSGSMSSLSSAASSYNTFCTNQRNEEEIFENVQSLSHLIHEPPSLSAAAISPSPKRVSPTSSPSQRHNNGNDSNSTHAHEPILSAISKLYTHNLSHASRSSSKEPELSASPCDDGLYLDSHHPQSDLPNQISINQHHDLKPNVSEQQDRECSPSTKERRTNNIIDSTLFNGIRTVNNYITREETQDPEEEEEKKEEADDDAQHLTDLMQKHVLKRAVEEVDITKLLHDVTGNAAYFKSVCHLLKTLIICELDTFQKVPFGAMHFARFRYLLQCNEYKVRYNEHIRLLNIPNYLKAEAVLDSSWNQSEGTLQSSESVVSVLDIFNVILRGMTEDKTQNTLTHPVLYSSMTSKAKHLFITNLMQQNCLHHVFDLLEYVVSNGEWQCVGSIFRFFTYLIKAKPTLFRELMLKKHINQSSKDKHVEEWCSNFILKQIAKCLESCTEEDEDHESILAICKFLFELSSSFRINADQFSASYYKKYAMNADPPSPDLCLIVNEFIARMVEKTELLDYDEKEAPFLLEEYYETLTMMISLSRMSKIICCYHCKIGDFVKFITNRLSQTMALFILKAAPKHNKTKTLNLTPTVANICGEMIRVLQLIQNILYLAPAEIKTKFAANHLGELLVKLYSHTLYKNKRIYDVHDMLLSVCVNFVAHCQEAKHAVSQNGFLIKILKEAFDGKTRASSYSLCFDILDSMMLSIEGIHVLIKNNHLLHKSVNLISSSKNRKHPKRSCCMKLLRNLSMQSVGQTYLIKYFLPKKLDPMIAWLDPQNEDTQFVNICCAYLRNLGFITEFKLAFASNKPLILKIFDILLQKPKTEEEKEDGNANVEIRLSLITLLWSLIHKNNKNIAFIRKLPSPSLLPLIQRITKLNKQTKWDKKSNHHVKILLNSLLDRCKFVNKLLIGL